MSQPKYVQVMDFLQEDIQGKPPQTPILSEREISQRLDISRMTVRKAIEQLCRQGVLYRGGNRGTFVARRPASVTVSGSAPRQERQRVLFLDCVNECANVRDVQKAFGLEDHQRLFRMVRLILDDDLPLRVGINKLDLLGEPAIGRRFKGEVWLQGLVEFPGQGERLS